MTDAGAPPNPIVPRRLDSADDRVDAIATFADAFFDDPVFSWIFEDRGVRQRYLAAWFENTVDRAAHGSHVDLVGGAAAFWMPPKTPGSEHPSESGDGWVVPFLSEALGDDVAMSKLAELGKIPEHHPTEPHWYLGVIGTRSDAQGRGLGSRLLTHHLQICDDEASADGPLPAYLESSNPRNVSLYLRHGWQVTNTIELNDGPTLTGMWRPARRTNSEEGQP